MSTFKDITNQKFNMLTAIRFVKRKNKDSIWLFKCDCGVEKELIANNIKNNGTKSCGCLRKEILSKRKTKHKLSNHRLFIIWSGMIARCYNSKNRDYPNYGGKGIIIDDIWKNDFQKFYDWAINNGYDKSLSIDRINNDGNYEPSNCRWATNIVQCRNKTNNHIISAFGESKTLVEWIEDKRCVVKYSIVLYRLKNNITPEVAMTTPKGMLNKKEI